MDKEPRPGEPHYLRLRVGESLARELELAAQFSGEPTVEQYFVRAMDFYARYTSHRQTGTLYLLAPNGNIEEGETWTEAADPERLPQPPAQEESRQYFIGISEAVMSQLEELGIDAETWPQRAVSFARHVTSLESVGYGLVCADPTGELVPLRFTPYEPPIT